jgi:curved DNA-binding protein CbpA
VRRRVPDHYRVLGVPRDADLATIRAAYRSLAKRYHPDLTASLPPGEHAEADTRMREVNAAYHALTRDRDGHDAQLRRQERSVDRMSNEPGPVPRGQRPTGPRRGDDDVMSVTLDARESREGVVFASGIDGEPIWLPPGVEPGRHRLEGRGHFGTYGGPRGDLWVEVHVLAPLREPRRRPGREPAARHRSVARAGAPVLRVLRVVVTVVLGVSAFLAAFVLWQRFVAGG